MEPKDVIEQLIGDCNEWDQNDTMSFTFYEVEKDGVSYPSVNVDFELGVVEYYNDKDEVALKFAIKATLEPLEA